MNRASTIFVDFAKRQQRLKMCFRVCIFMAVMTIVYAVAFIMSKPRQYWFLIFVSGIFYLIVMKAFRYREELRLLKLHFSA